MDHNANHVIQKCFEIIPAEKVEFILKALIDDVNK
jgi:hypothetical protein